MGNFHENEWKWISPYTKLSKSIPCYHYILCQHTRLELIMSLMSMKIEVYSETTWGGGIAQLTHHEVQGGGKNPETGGLGIFAPHRGLSGELIV